MKRQDDSVNDVTSLASHAILNCTNDVLRDMDKIIFRPNLFIFSPIVPTILFTNIFQISKYLFMLVMIFGRSQIVSNNVFLFV